MSQENVEGTRKAWDRFLANDMPGLLAFLDAEVRVHDVPGLPDASVYYGHQGYLEQIAKFREAFSEISYEPLEFTAAGEQVVIVIAAHGVATGSGIASDVTYAQVDTWHNGKIVDIQYFLSKAEALEAVGLSE